jgi:hypothetical protein
MMIKAHPKFTNIAKQFGVHLKFFLRNHFGHIEVALHIVLCLMHHLSLNPGDEFTLLSDQLCFLFDTSQMLIEQVFFCRNFLFIFII